MERTVPSTGSEEIDLYLRTFYSLLRTTSEIQIKALEEAHAGMKSLLHPEARGQAPDMSAFIYSVLRLPECINRTRLVVLGQSTEAFRRGGNPDVESWMVASAPARRRRCYFDGVDTMAIFISSRTDIDDIIPLLTAYQIEWNKLHRLLLHLPPDLSLETIEADREDLRELAEHLQMSLEDLERLRIIWEDDFSDKLSEIAGGTLRFQVQLLGSSLSGYRRATQSWFQAVLDRCPEVVDRPLYFVSSNTHSLLNILTGFALQHQGELVDFVERSGNHRLHQEWKDIQARLVPSSRENYFYYLLKVFLGSSEGEALDALRQEAETSAGVRRIPPDRCFDIEAQVIDLAALRLNRIDPRLQTEDLDALAGSEALIVNIDYPLGMAAYNILSKVSEFNHRIRGVYVIGKAATLNGVIGDVMIPGVIHDEHSQNTYLFTNCFSAADVAPYLVYGTVLDNQKGVTVRGTFLQNDRYMDVFYREGYTDIEMEAGPYLSAVYEMVRPVRHPVNEIVNLHESPVDLGFLHYASDTPLSKGKNLGAGSMSYFGMDPTYATSLAVLRRILQLELDRVRSPRRKKEVVAST